MTDARLIGHPLPLWYLFFWNPNRPIRARCSANVQFAAPWNKCCVPRKGYGGAAVARRRPLCHRRPARGHTTGESGIPTSLLKYLVWRVDGRRWEACPPFPPLYLCEPHTIRWIPMVLRWNSQKGKACEMKSFTGNVVLIPLLTRGMIKIGK